MNPVTVKCEACDGKRYSNEALMYKYHDKNVMEILDMTAEDALDFFKDDNKIYKEIKAMNDVGLSYLSLGQPLSTLSGGEIEDNETIEEAMIREVGEEINVIPTKYEQLGEISFSKYYKDKK